jgi:hypothetical protein
VTVFVFVETSTFLTVMCNLRLTIKLYTQVTSSDRNAETILLEASVRKFKGDTLLQAIS